MTQPPSAPTWTDVIDEPAVVLVVGRRGGGKTATGHRLLEVFGDSGPGRDAYIMGYPDDRTDQLPYWIDTLPATAGLDEWPDDSVVLVHEAHHIAHARESHQAENLSVDKLVTVSRHRNSDIIFETQQTQRLDRNFPAAADCIIVKQPALMQADFERRAMRDIIEAANDTFEQYRTVHEADEYRYVDADDDIVKHAYVHADTFIGEYPHEIQLAEHWSEDISKAYADADVFGDADDGGNGDDGLNADETATLNAVAAWEREHRPLAYDHQGAQYDDVGAQPYTLSQLELNGLLEKVYSSSNKANRYRLTDEGWAASGATEPDGPVVAEGG